MRVGYDATTLTLRRSGIGRYTLELLYALIEHEPELDLRLMAHRRINDDLARNGLASIERLGGPGFPVKLAWMQAVLPFALARSELDVCHFTNYHAPLISNVPSVVNLHDMSLVMMPERHPRLRVATMRPLLRTVAQHSSAVLCLTASARADAISHLDLDPARVRVVSAAPARAFHTITDESRLAAVAARHGLEPGFLLFVGTIEPRKNLIRLVQAYARLRRDGFGAPLVICGAPGWKSGDLVPTIDRLGLSAHVIFTGFVPDDDLAALLNLARGFVYPSLYEGFGLPIIEAFACGVPVVTSNRGATAEVAGGAALLADPEDVDDLTSALASALTDEPTRSRLRAAGLERATHYTWQRAAHETAAIYRSAIATPR